ncbi:fimbria/pilus outer membrane usher protein [Pseudomonas ovata]|uniref:fimbria/pilus outer membrane usher protein n=1 Tax=Pseudomonas ovata TaxID=1839709 RepID=UPI000D6A01E6|nr:fimbria/pilus outer membrane usher protein [Pseudomonas ovata]
MEWLIKNNKGFRVRAARCPGKRLAGSIAAGSFSSHRLPLGVGLGLSLSVSALGAQATGNHETGAGRFNTAFIQGSDQPPDLEEFLRASAVLPGVYRVDIHVNRSLGGRRDVEFVRNTHTGRVEPCLSLDMLRELGLDLQKLPQQTEPLPGCFDLAAQVEFARVEYQPGALRLNISVPQALMARSARGYVSPQLWDQGETAGFINYSFNSGLRTQRGQRHEQHYLGLRNGLNLGAWRLRNESSLVQGDDQPYRFRSNRTFVQRDITTLKSQLTLGETFSDGQIFDSVRFKGAALISDDGMLPDSERNYVPVVRGIAETNATVEVRQNGFLLYSGNVSPGPFEVTDIYPSGSNGDLLVTVIEADGRRRSFTQAYASLPIMLPAGAFRYSLSGGQVDDNEGAYRTTRFLSGAWIHGFGENLTDFGGVQLAKDYQAVNLGAGINTGLGALSADLTHSSSELRGQRQGGQSLRLRYANTLDLTRTTLAVAGYRYSTAQYRTLGQHVEASGEREGLSIIGRARDRVEINVTQTLADQAASLSLTASEQRYWNLPGKTRQAYLSWNSMWGRLTYSLSIERNQSYSRSGESSADNRVVLSLTLPLGETASASRLFFNAVRDSQGGYNLQSGLNGQVLDQRDSFYSVQAGHDSQSGSFGAGKLSTVVPYGRFEAGYSQGRDYRSLQLGGTGSLVAHAGGVNFGQPLGETFALVQVPEVRGASLATYRQVETAGNGYAVLPFAQPYRSNWISLDTRQLGADVELDNAVGQVVPRRGAMPVLRFKAAVGRRVQFSLVRPDAGRLPLGATVEDAQGKVLATVDPTSQALVLSEQDSGMLYVRWADQRCAAPFQLPPRDPSRAYERLRVVCQ